MTTSISGSILTTVYALALVLLAPQAWADPKPQRTLEPSLTVRFGDLKPSTAEGSRVLYGRISEAARTVCDPTATWHPGEYWAWRECYRATVDKVVAKLNLPALTALHYATTHRAPSGPGLQAGNE